MSFLDTYKALLPDARAWALTIDKQLRQFFEGLSEFPADVQVYFEEVYFDLFPQTTRELEAWENQFSLFTGEVLTVQERRDRLAAAWKALGGQSPRYLQDSLQARGFDVYIHEWWEFGSAPPIVRSPFAALSAESGFPYVQCGEPLSECGEPSALFGNGPGGGGYLLVNKLLSTSRKIMSLAGAGIMHAGHTNALSGYFEELAFTEAEYNIPLDPAFWPYFLYIGGEVFPEKADVPIERREEFEDLCLRLCPAQQWLVLLINYV